MKYENDFYKQCLEQACHLRDVVPIYRIRERTIDEMESQALRFAGRFAGNRDGMEIKSSLRRRQDRSDFFLPEGLRARVFHASGAFIAKSSLGPMEALLAEDIEQVAKDDLIKQVDRALQRLELVSFCGREERLEFERLWQIKATGVTKKGERGRVVLCRSVGAYRRYLHDLPVWGRASVHVQMAADDHLDSIGIDWRLVSEEPFDHAKIIDPEHGAKKVLADFQSRLPSAKITRDDFKVVMFALGYFSLPRRRSQGTMAPVYVAMIESNGWPGSNHLIVVPATETIYEPLCVPVETPPRLAKKPEPKGRRKIAPSDVPVKKPVADVAQKKRQE
jgi:hypothetical protein